MTTLGVHIPTGTPCAVIDQYRDGSEGVKGNPMTLIDVGRRTEKAVPSREVRIVRFGELKPSREFMQWQDSK
jgi:hypothetical protein